jgi:hypothetical protein
MEGIEWKILRDMAAVPTMKSPLHYITDEINLEEFGKLFLIKPVKLINMISLLSSQEQKSVFNWPLLNRR